MGREQQSDERSTEVYDLHHSLDTLIFTSVNRVLKAKSLREAHKHFYLDFVKDVGIINLLRKEYFRSGRIKKIFRLYQGTRRDPENHHYESLFALLVITITGSVMSGVILELYKDNKEKIGKFVNRSVIDKVRKRKDTDNVVKKFSDVEAKRLMLDFVSLKNAYLARLMLDRSIITLSQYCCLVDFFLDERRVQISNILLGKYKVFQEAYKKLNDYINEDMILQAIKIYARGTVIQYLEQIGIEIPPPKGIKTAFLLRGLAAAPGVGKGKSILFVPGMSPTRFKQRGFLLCIDSNHFNQLPDDVFVMDSANGIITCNCGMISHIPLICRGMGKPCVVIKEKELHSLKDKDNMWISGTVGIIATGVLVGE